jgi:ATP phosphoribosyltransferase
VAVKSDSGYQRSLDLPAHARVASKFVQCALTHFHELDLPVEIVPLYGSVELGPITGMSEAIVDLVSTGRTLRENGLVEVDLLFESTAHLIAHPISYRLNQGDLAHYCQAIQEMIQTKQRSV